MQSALFRASLALTSLVRKARPAAFASQTHLQRLVLFGHERHLLADLVQAVLELREHALSASTSRLVLCRLLGVLGLDAGGTTLLPAWRARG